MKQAVYCAAIGAAFLVAGCTGDNLTSPAKEPVGMWIPGSVRGDIIGNPGATDGIQRGVYYFAGWKNYQQDEYRGEEVPHATDPWGLIRDAHSPYSPDRKPGLGFIDEDNQATADAHILMMQDAGFDFVAYEVGWAPLKSRGDWPYGDPEFFQYAATNHKTSQYASKVKMALTWHDPYGAPEKLSFWSDYQWTQTQYVTQFLAMVDRWFTSYIDNNPNFYTVDGAAVIFIFAPENLQRVSNVFGLNALTMTNHIRSVATSHGKSVYLVGTSVEPNSVSQLSGWGFNAFSGYQYGGGYSYAAVTSYTQSQWSAALTSSTLTYWPSVITGGNGLAWNGPNLGNNVISTFETHLDAAVAFTNANAARTRNFLMTCCWNEWGEGEYMQPSSYDGFVLHKGSALSDAHRRNVLGQANGSNNMPSGWFDAIDSNGLAWGWSVDPDTPNQSIHLHFYVDGPYGGGGTYIGGALTDLFRGDINSAQGISGNHGFAFQIPAQYQGRQIYIHQIDASANGQNPVLGGSPRSW